jgi:large subunit ribosomal protein L30
MSKIKVTRTKSSICRIDVQIETLKHLGLRKVNHSVILEDNAVVRGMIKKVEHMVKVSPVND